jgi:hypothetical protein
MSNGAHVATTQETVIYEALYAGDQQAIGDMRQTAYGADQTRPADAPEDWVAPAEQYDLDYGYAWSHYQKDHEAPDAARERATQAAVADENETAAALTRGAPS